MGSQHRLVGADDLATRHIAALHTIDDYRARNHADLIAVAQTVGFGFAALASISQSFDDDISLSMTLRLRGNAVACNRAAESQSRLETEEPIAPQPTQAATRTPEEKRHQQMWAIAMAKEASEISASLRSLPPAERETAAMRAGLLGSTATT
jgi:hypothetical protein